MIGAFNFGMTLRNISDDPHTASDCLNKLAHSHKHAQRGLLKGSLSTFSVGNTENVKTQAYINITTTGTKVKWNVRRTTKMKN